MPETIERTLFRETEQVTVPHPILSPSAKSVEGTAMARWTDGSENDSPHTNRFALTPLWYALRTRAHHEKKVRDQLMSREVEVFLPTYERWSHWKDRRVKVELPLFPGYAFARFPLAERLRIFTVPGVAHLVGTKGSAEVVPEREIADIRRLVESGVHYDPHPFLSEGMEVEVVRGPLAGVRGKLLRKDRATRLVLAVTLLRQAAAVSIHPADVRAV
jgi:transcription termination/antitermination protein NusG